MGSGQTKIVTENNHCDFYYKGKSAVNEGRYTNAELYFHQALSQHAGRPFWDTLLQAVFKKDTINKREGLGDQDVLNLVDELNEEQESTGEEISQETTSKSHHSQLKKKTLILPTDKNIVPVMDYIRMCMDISLCYLTQPGDEKNGRIALLYCIFVSMSMQTLWSFLYTWIERKKEEHDDTATVTGENGENQSQKSKKHKGDKGEEEIKKDTEKNVLVKFSFGHNSERPSEKEINDWIHRFVPLLRYYCHSATTNYSVLVILLSAELDATDVKRRKIIHQNVIDMSNKVQFDLLALAKQFPEGEAAQTMVKYMPSLDYFIPLMNEVDQQTPSEDKSGGASKSSAHRSEFYGSFTSSGMGRQTFVSSCRDFPITCPLLTDITSSVDLDFDVDFDIPRKDLYYIQTPAERNACHYIQWYTAEQLIYVPGHNTHFLTKALPHYYTPPPNGPHSSLKIKYRSLENSMAKALLSAEAAKKKKLLTSYETNTDANVMKKIASEDVDLCVNSRLDFKDTLTLRKLALEEAFICSMALFIITVKLLSKVGDVERAKEFIVLIERTSDMLYGQESDEYKLFTTLQHSYGF